MKFFLSSAPAIFLLSSLGSIFGAAPDDSAYDEELVSRLLGSEAERAARDLSGTMTVPKQMYKELIYKEKMCEDYIVISLNGTLRNIDRDATDLPLLDGDGFPTVIDDNAEATFTNGDVATFKCELYEEDIRFGMYGGRRVGETYWGCRITHFVDFTVDALPFVLFNDPVWDCTITDYIGRDEDDDVDDPLADADPLDQLRNEGLILHLFDPNIRTGPLWDRHHSHEGVFATTGGVGIGKGARGQLEVKWDDYSMTWFHIYTVEVWNLEQEKLLKQYPGYW